MFILFFNIHKASIFDILGFIKNFELETDFTNEAKNMKLFYNYYDKYKKGLKWLKQTQGTVRPNLWNQSAPKRKKRKKPSATPPEAPSS